jgi:hypothetical protein
MCGMTKIKLINIQKIKVSGASVLRALQNWAEFQPNDKRVCFFRFCIEIKRSPFGHVRRTTTHSFQILRHSSSQKLLLLLLCLSACLPVVRFSHSVGCIRLEMPKEMRRIRATNNRPQSTVHISVPLTQAFHINCATYMTGDGMTK